VTDDLRGDAYGPAIDASLAALVLLITMIATWMPARRTRRIDPVQALRSEQAVQRRAAS